MKSMSWTPHFGGEKTSEMHKMAIQTAIQVDSSSEHNFNNILKEYEILKEKGFEIFFCLKIEASKIKSYAEVV